MRVSGEHLSGTPRRGEEYGFDSQLLKRTDKSCYDCRLARTGVAIEQKYLTVILARKPIGQLFYDFFLVKSCVE